MEAKALDIQHQDLVNGLVREFREIKDFNVDALRRQDLGKANKLVPLVDVTLGPAIGILVKMSECSRDQIGKLPLFLLNDIRLAFEQLSQVRESIYLLRLNGDGGGLGDIELNAQAFSRHTSQLAPQAFFFLDGIEFPRAIARKEIADITGRVTQALEGIKADAEVARKRLDDLHNESGKKIETGLEEIEFLKAAADEALNTAKRAAEMAGLAAYGEAFRAEAVEHGKAAIGWLCASGVAAVAIFVWVVFSHRWWFSPTDDSTWAIAQQVGNKIVVVSMLSYMMVSFIKNYRASRHNCVVNKHRQNALATFEAFTSASGADHATKHAVLLQATQAIFAFQPTGYSEKDTGGPMPTNVIEVLKALPGDKNGMDRAA